MGLMDDDPKVSWLESTLGIEKELIECDDEDEFQFVCVPIHTGKNIGQISTFVVLPVHVPVPLTN